MPHAHSVFVQRTFCPFRIRYIFVLSVIHPLHVRELTVLCPLLVRYVCVFTDFRDDLHRHRGDFYHRIILFAFFCPFSVRGDSTIKNGIFFFFLFFFFFFFGGGGVAKISNMFLVCLFLNILGMIFILLINVKIVGILTFIIKTNTTSEGLLSKKLLHLLVF